MVEIGEVEEDVAVIPPSTPTADDAERQRRSDGDLGVEGRLGPVDAGDRVDVADVEALEQAGGVASSAMNADEPERVVAERERDRRADAAGERSDERADDRELLPVEEVEAELGQLDDDDVGGLAEDQLEDRRRLEQLEVDRARLCDA